MLSIHRVSHRLQLAVIDVSKDIAYLKIFDNVVRNTFKFYHSSSKRLLTLKEISEVLGEEILKLRDIHTVRRLASKVSAVTALLLPWKAIVTHLEQLICNNESDAPITKGLLNDMKQFKFVKFLHFFTDFYSMLYPLSVALQNQELLISSLKVKIEHVICTLNELKSNVGVHEKEFLNLVSLSGKYKRSLF
jgi:hypothetical protein